MDDAEADSTANDVKVYSDALINAIKEKQYDEATEYVTKIQEKLKDIALYVERKKVAF